MENPARPLTFILGGAKIYNKIKLIEKVINITDNVIICGAISYTFLKKSGKPIGNSYFS